MEKKRKENIYISIQTAVKQRVFSKNLFYSFDYLDETIFACTLKNQISALTIDINTNEGKRPNVTTTETFLIDILTMFPNLRILNLAQNAFWHQHLSFATLPPTVVSSTLLELYVCLIKFDDCLSLLNGRFKQLRTFDAKVQSIWSSSSIIDNKVEKFA